MALKRLDHMARFIFALSLLFSAASSMAANTTLVMLVDVNCPFCRVLHGADKDILYEAKKANVDVIYAPIPNDGDYSTAWAEKVFYACREVGVCDERAVLDALYSSQDAEKLNTFSDVKVWLSAITDDFNGVSSALERAKNEESQNSVIRALRLAAAVKISQFPAFAVVGDGYKPPYQIANRRDAPLSSRTKKVTNWLKAKQ